MSAGYRPGQKLMLVTDSRGKASRRWMRWDYSSIEDSPRHLVARMNTLKPHVLYGCVTPLRQMALHLQAAAAPHHRPHIVVSTAESLDEPTRRLLRETFGVPVYDVYGLTEMGMVAWECRQHDGYHVAEDTTIVEFVPVDKGGARSLVMTNLELNAMPLIRFATGDLGIPGPTARCACGRYMRRLKRIEGRLVDCIRLRDGQSVSPYRFTIMLEQIPGITRYQLIQEDLDQFVVRLEQQGTVANAIVEAAIRAVRQVAGPNVNVRVIPVPNLDVAPGRKFRVVECRIGSGGNQ
jgi:phenylacetate-CoA ligase